MADKVCIHPYIYSKSLDACILKIGPNQLPPPFPCGVGEVYNYETQMCEVPPRPTCPVDTIANEETGECDPV